MARIQWHPRWQAQVTGLPEVDRAVHETADDMADRAQTMAPKRTGAGAASIHSERQPDGSYRVSWDKEHDYMRFAEFGTTNEQARPFLRPAAHSTGR